MKKYDYWHIIIKVNEEYQKKNPHIKVGCCITQSYIMKKQSVYLFDLKNGVSIDCAYDVDYIGRVHKGLSNKIKIKKIEDYLEKWKLKNKKLSKQIFKNTNKQ